LWKSSSVAPAFACTTPKLVHYGGWGAVDLLGNLTERIAKLFEDPDTASFFKSQVLTPFTIGCNHGRIKLIHSGLLSVNFCFATFILPEIRYGFYFIQLFKFILQSTIVII
jgi:hypothetical protein